MEEYGRKSPCGIGRGRTAKIKVSLVVSATCDSWATGTFNAAASGAEDRTAGAPRPL